LAALTGSCADKLAATNRGPYLAGPITAWFGSSAPASAQEGLMLSAFQKRKLANLFALHDLNHDGELDHEDYTEYAHRLAAEGGLMDSSKHQTLETNFLRFWDMLRQMADRNNDRKVTIREWYDCFEQLLSSPDSAQKMRPIGEAVFSMLDRNGDGVLTIEEFRWLYSSGALDPKLAADSFRRLDTDHDGRITTAELSARLFEFFLSDAPDTPGNWLFGPVAADRAVPS
jgi:Ca2+-binding EF-hand superfamily protein